MGKFIRLAGRLSLLLLFISGLAGCSPAAEATPAAVFTVIPTASQSPVPPTPGPPVTYRLAVWADGMDADTLQELVEQVNDQAIGYQITLETNLPEDLDGLEKSLADPEGPDLFWVRAGDLPALATQGFLLDITSDLQAVPNPSAAADLVDYYPEALKTARYRDHYYGLPWTAEPLLLFYNQALFDKAGLAYPDETWDWNRFEQAAGAMTVDFDGDGRQDQWGFIMDAWPPAELFIWQAGGELIGADLHSSPVDSDAAVNGLDFYSKLIYDDAHTPRQDVIAQYGYDPLIQAGKVGMFIGTATQQFSLPEGMAVGAAPLPAGPATQDTPTEVISTAISAQVTNPKLAYQALLALTEAFQDATATPPRQSLATAAQIERVDPGLAPFSDAILYSMQYLRTANVIPRQAEWQSVFQAELVDKAVRHTDDPRRLANRARPHLEELLPSD